MNGLLANKQRLAAIVVALAAGSAFLSAQSFSLPQSVTTDPTTQAATDWQVAEAGSKNMQGFHIAVSTLRPWGQQTAPVVSKPVEQPQVEVVASSAQAQFPNFRGIVQTGTTRYLVFFEPKENAFTYYKPQQQLPDGSQVLTIASDAFTIQAGTATDDATRIIKLYQN